jgi:RHS repeat-associated protein
VHTGHLGAPLLYTTSTGTATTPPAAISLPGFPGQLRTLPDLIYNRYRDYDPTTGRYIQADPIGLEGGANMYRYAEGNPLKYVDPDGLNAVRGAVVVGELAGEGLWLWCRSNMATCMATIGRAAIWVAGQCNFAGDDRQACHEKCIAQSVGRGYGSDAPAIYWKCMRNCLRSKGIDY